MDLEQQIKEARAAYVSAEIVHGVAMDNLRDAVTNGVTKAMVALEEHTTAVKGGAAIAQIEIFRTRSIRVADAAVAVVKARVRVAQLLAKRGE